MKKGFHAHSTNFEKACSICLLAMAAANAPVAWAQSLTSKGTDFYATFTQNSDTLINSLDPSALVLLTSLVGGCVWRQRRRAVR
ncbi:hypothetical protein [Comamonas sp. 4034]|uniref:hypothetical protein n=1 Tax=Comamonas sp. 4034 TaxID=3156455 RepID=UPI003D2170B2